MSDEKWFIITIFYAEAEQILKVALCINDQLTDDQIEYYLDPENKKAWHDLLPLHVRSCGPIVDIDKIFDGKKL